MIELMRKRQDVADGTLEAQRLEALLTNIRACTICRVAPRGKPLPHEPRPVLRAEASARIAICGQAPGTRVHASGMPFTDPSGVRLRRWLGVTDEEFYDASRIAIVPMGFCFPGLTAEGYDLPPRKECAPAWRASVFALLPKVELVLAVGRPAQLWHLGKDAGPTLGAAVADWRRLIARSGVPVVAPLPHPSWRNNTWLKKNPWFEAEAAPAIAGMVRSLLDS
ncbi:uracil-DNA glycosylase family protein [Hansschlegelia quercus]|uniref:Uracil-DNA glycosylase family protein n=2 Tax=Hansschlegelia quercus TaxID=2528245 RepID=A0A4V2JED2_9HYPH|nr:uracil-DNA glycosylase family protein [Hansschlegelia quercus]